MERGGGAYAPFHGREGFIELMLFKVATIEQGGGNRVKRGLRKDGGKGRMQEKS